MRKRFYLLALVIALVTVVPQSRALQSASPEGALEEMVTAQKLDDLIRHLPVKVQQFFEKMPQQQRAEMEGKLLVARTLEHDGGKLTRLDDVTWELVQREGAPKITFRLKKSFISGTDALLQFELQEKERITPLMLSMRFEENDWRVMETGEWHGTNIESQFLTEKMSQEHEANPALTLQMLNTCLLTYISNYPETGYPASLQALSMESNQQQPTAEHAMLLDPSFLEQPAETDGYEFRYLRTAPDHYEIVAIPQQFREGAKSYFTDDTAVIRFTTENRAATAGDPAIE